MRLCTCVYYRKERRDGEKMNTFNGNVKETKEREREVNTGERQREGRREFRLITVKGLSWSSLMFTISTQNISYVCVYCETAYEPVRVREICTS